MHILNILLWSFVIGTDIRALEVFQMRCLREIAGISLLQRQRNEAIRELCLHQPTMENAVRKTRLRWFGHVCRMTPRQRDPWQLVFNDIPKNWRATSRKPWIDVVEADLAFLKDTYGAALWLDRWLELAADLAADRAQWRRITERAQELARHSDGHQRPSLRR